MADRKYYARCESGCLFETMTKEQILAAIAQAVETGKIKDVDAGFITKIVEQNGNIPMSIWIGSAAEYNALSDEQKNSSDVVHFVKDGGTIAVLKQNVEQLREEVSGVKDIVEQMQQGKIKVPKASSADNATNATGFTARDGTFINIANCFPYFSTNGEEYYSNTVKPLDINTLRSGLYFFPNYNAFAVLKAGAVREWCLQMTIEQQLDGELAIVRYLLYPQEKGSSEYRIHKETYTHNDLTGTLERVVVHDVPEFTYVRICDFTM